MNHPIQSAPRSASCVFLLLGLISLALVSCEKATAPPPPDAAVVYAVAETDPVRSGGDAADDAAIWINAQNPSASLIIGTDKQSGIEVYDLAGARVQFVPAGLANNVDLRTFSQAGDWAALAAASNRTANTISLFLIDRKGTLTWLQDSEVTTGLTEVYGLCMFRNDQGMQVFVNDTDGRFQQWGLFQVDAGESAEPMLFEAELLREFSVPGQPEGCVADDTGQRLFLGVEEVGVRTLSARYEAPAVLLPVMDIDGTILAADVEGMSLYLADDSGYLIVSSQGNNSYAIFDRLSPFSYRGSFVVADSEGRRVDGTQDTDGLDVSSVSLGPDYPEGILVIQDGINQLPGASQNFKYLSWHDIAIALAL